MTAAAEVLTSLAEKPYTPRKVEPVSRSFAAKLCDRLRQRERTSFSNTTGTDAYTPVADLKEVTYIVEELWQSRSAYSGIRLESRRVLELTRFDRSKPALPYNLILVTKEEAALHDAETAQTQVEAC